MIPAHPQHIKKLSNGSEEQDKNNRANPSTYYVKGSAEKPK